MAERTISGQKLEKTKEARALGRSNKYSEEGTHSRSIYSFIGRETIGQWCIGFFWVKSWKVEFVATETKSQDKPRQLTIRACFYSQIQN